MAEERTERWEICRSSFPVLDECSVPVLFHGDTKLHLRVHDDRSVPGNWLMQWFPRNQEKPDWFVLRRNQDLTPILKQYNMLGCLEPIPLDVEVIRTFHLVAERVLLVAEVCLPLEHIGEHGVSWFCRMGEF